MATFDFNSITKALSDNNRTTSGVDFSGKSLKLDTEKDAQPIVDAINKCPDLQYLTLTGNTLGVAAAQAIARALEHHPELKVARFSDMFTGRMKTEIPPALSALGDGMIAAGARLQSLDLSDNAFGPIGVEGLAKLLESEVCSQLQELRLNNNGLGITGGKLLAKALSSNPRRLKVFVAGRNRLENDGAKALAAVFQNMGTLEEVAMPQNGIYHVGITALSEAFRRNPRLSTLNLNDNTVGAKGAAALARALPSLKNLKTMNFGDCLLKSKGAKALAKAFKDNSHTLESLDLSHNEIGREACMEVVDSIMATDKLNKLVLAGNSLGGASNKKTIRDKLGSCAELSDGEGGSDDEYVTDSEEEEEGSDEEGESEDEDSDDTQINESADIVRDVTLDSSGVTDPEEEDEGSDEEAESEDDSDSDSDDTQINESADIVRDVTLDSSGVTDPEEEDEGSDEEAESANEDSDSDDTQINESADIVRDVTLDSSGVEEIETDVGKFLREPTIENLNRLGSNAAEVIDTHLQSIKDTSDLIQAYVEATFCVSGLSDQNASAADVANQLYPLLIKRAGQRHAAAWILADAMLRGLGLIKSENKNYKIRWLLPPCFTCLGSVIEQAYFPGALRDTLRFFIASKLPLLPPATSAAINRAGALKQS